MSAKIILKLKKSQSASERPPNRCQYRKAHLERALRKHLAFYLRNQEFVHDGYCLDHGLSGSRTGNPGSVIVPQYGSSKITVFVLGKTTFLKFVGNTKYKSMKLTMQLVVVVLIAPTKFRDNLFKFTPYTIIINIQGMGQEMPSSPPCSHSTQRFPPNSNSNRK